MLLSESERNGKEQRRRDNDEEGSLYEQRSEQLTDGKAEYGRKRRHSVLGS